MKPFHGRSALWAILLAWPAAGFAISSAPYLPLADGNRWDYQMDGGPIYYDQVLSTQSVNGYPTKAYYDSEDDTTYNYSNDANGIRRHQEYTPSVFIDGCGFSSLTGTYSPPLVLATADVTLGQIINSSGNVTVTLPSTVCAGTYLYTYQATSNIVGFETVTVPAGIFIALRVYVSASLYYEGVFQSSTFNTYWVTENVGVVQSTYSEGGPTYTYKLTSTNVVRTAPDPFSFTAQTGVTPGSVVTSNAITVSSTTAASPISVTGGQYSINGGAWTSAVGTVSNGQSVALRQTASASFNTTTDAVLTIGGVSATFAVTTGSVPSYLLTVAVSGSGTVTSNPAGINCGSDCTESYTSGTVVTLTAAPGAAGSVGSFSGGGCSGTIECTVTMDQARTVSVNFIANTFTINKVGSGTVTWSQTSPDATFTCGTTCSRNIRQGATVTLISAVGDSGYSFSGWSGGGCSGTGSCAIVMNAPTTVTATFFIDTQAPTVPTGLTATAVSSGQISVRWSAASDNVGVSAYQIFRGGALLTTVNAPALRFSDTGLAATTSYSYTVAACDAAGNCSAQSSAVSATTLAPGQYAFSPELELGFNLLGNSLNLTLDVAAIFGNQDAPTALTPNIVTLWKWNAAQGRWAFYSPQLTVSGIASFAASKGYEVLAAINPGEGYWVNALLPMTLPAQSGSGFNWTGINFPALPTGFNLIAHAAAMTPSLFNINVSATPPSPGVVPTENFVSLWAWDALQGKWYFYSPLLEASGGLPAVKSYADSNFYLHFQDYNKQIEVGVGFWVNRP